MILRADICPLLTILILFKKILKNISRFFEKGLSIPEVALISGHKDVRMLFRYTHLKAEDLISKI